MDDQTPDGRSSQGKISRLPPDIRAELNKKLYAGETATTILPWLNAVPEVQKVLAAQFDNVPISENNLSRWRKGGYQDWLRRQERLDHIRELSGYAADLARQGGDGSAGPTVAAGAVNIASGQILELLEAVEDAGAKLDVESLTNLSRALNALRTSEQNQVKLAIEQNKLSLAEQQLALDKQRFQRQTLDLFLKWRADQRAREIADSPADNSAKIEKLGQLIFGDDWKPSQPA